MTPCEIWDGVHNQLGYGYVGKKLAHRIAYEEARGPIPEKHDIHHLCDEPRCVNPDHLVAITRSLHIWITPRKQLGGVAPMDKTHCKYGHPFDGMTSGKRPQPRCRRCASAASKRYRQRKAAI